MSCKNNFSTAATAPKSAQAKVCLTASEITSHPSYSSTTWNSMHSKDKPGNSCSGAWLYCIYQPVTNIRPNHKLIYRTKCCFNFNWFGACLKWMWFCTPKKYVVYKLQTASLKQVGRSRLKQEKESRQQILQREASLPQR